jgi:hypothetical protein
LGFGTPIGLPGATRDLEGEPGGDRVAVGEWTAHDLQPERRATGGKPRRDCEGGMGGEHVEGHGQGLSEQRIDRHPADAYRVHAPPHEPLDVRDRSRGFRVTPHFRDQVTEAQENSGVALRAWGIAPAASARALAMPLVAAGVSGVRQQRPARCRLPGEIGGILDREAETLERSGFRPLPHVARLGLACAANAQPPGRAAAGR